MMRVATGAPSPRLPGSFRHLIQVELGRLAGRRRAMFVMLGIIGIGVFLTEIDEWSSPANFWRHHRHPLTFSCIIAGMAVAAGSFAEDRRTRHARLVLLRGYSRRSYAWAKALSIAGSTGVVAGLGYLGFLLTARFWFPPGIWLRPLLPDLVPLAFLTVVAMGLSLMGFLAGALTHNEYVAAFTPFFVIIAVIFIFPRATFSPAVQIEVWHAVIDPHPPAALTITGSFLYWLVLGTGLAALGSELFARSQQD